ncbi:hypothetical protein D5F01_LYC25059 [Larimichthys crocea]|uniref:PiggyBac transposable element-derived protein domain-containing protein n=1 Tax=Larimichthys crocea TaxID=215358 RepID=A0A6G0HDM8_LARCR|nr:hypothetical protein D5F01_LYC25059 [Larimichthys crocea]
MPDPATLGKCNFTRGRSPPPQPPLLCRWKKKRREEKKKKKKKKMKGERRERDEEAQRRIRGRVVLDVTKGLTGRNITCDNFFTSYELAQRLLLERNNTLLGTIRKNKPELPDALLALRGRRVLSSKFAFTRDTALVSYLAKKNKNVLLLSTFHTRTADVVGRRQRADNKPAVILDYNSNKGGVDNLDKVVATYSCRRMTARWPLAVFHNILDVSSYNAFVIWRELNPDWLPGKRNKRRVFLEQLGKALVAPLIERRTRLPRAEAAAAVVKTHRLAAGGGGGGGGGGCSGSGGVTTTPALPPPPPPPPSSSAAAATSTTPVNPPLPASKRKRCQVCPSKKDCKTQNVCRGCEKYICRGCALLYCPACANYFCSSSERGSV